MYVINVNHNSEAKPCIGNKQKSYIQIGNWVVKFNTCTEGGILPWGQWIYDHYNGSIALVWLGRDDTLQLPGHLPVLWHAHFFGTFLVYRYYWSGVRESLLKMTLYNSHDTLPVLYYDPLVSTLFWYLPQVTDLAISDPLVLIARFYGTTKVPGINCFGRQTQLKIW